MPALPAAILSSPIKQSVKHARDGDHGGLGMQAVAVLLAKFQDLIDFVFDADSLH